MKTCGTCKWAKAIAGDLRMRVCMYGPPSIIVMPQQTPQGIMPVPVTVRPNVGINDEAPSCHSAGVYGLDDLVFEPAGVIEHEAN